MTTQKLLDVYNYLSAHDPSQLPWNSTERLQTCFHRYFADLNRNVDFFNQWLPAVKERTDLRRWLTRGVSRSSAWRTIGARLAGLRPVRFHDLRHTFGTAWPQQALP